MFGNLNSAGRARLSKFAVVAAIGLLPAIAIAAALTAFAYSTTKTKVYYQFSTDEPFDAHRGVVMQGASVIRDRTWNMAPPVMGASAEFSDLTPATNYKLRVFAKWHSTGAWSLLREQPFTTK